MTRHDSIFRLLAITCMAGFFLSSCEPEFDEPPGLVIPIGDTVIVGNDTITDGFLKLSHLARIYQDSGTYKFVNDFNFYATVTADKIGGNFYKNVFIEDSSDALNMRTIADGGLYVGDVIRVNLNGSTISEYAGLLQLDSVDVDLQVVIQSNGNPITPQLVTLSDIISDSDLQARIVQIDEVEFADGDLGSTYADPEGTSAQNTYIQDCNGNEIIVRTSDFCSFAGTIVPSGNGSIIAIVSRFNNDFQLLLRRSEEVDFTSLRCDGSTGEYLLFKNFEDMSISSGGWTQQIVIGSDDWFVDDFSGNNFAKVSNFNGSSNDPSEVWLISPAVDLSATTSPTLSFLSIMNYAGPQLETMVSTDYGSVLDVETAMWTELSPTYSPGGWEETLSGPLDLSAYISSDTYIAFRYTGSNSDGSTWEVDDIAIYDN